jgi:Neuraminidase (sialidase)
MVNQMLIKRSYCMALCSGVFVGLLASGVVARSPAAQWSPLQSLSATDSIGSPGGTHPLAASGDTVHAVWWQAGAIRYSRSDDAGRTWAHAMTLTTSPTAQYPCSLEMAGTVLHLIWVDDRNHGWEFYYMRSTDAGKTWGKEVRLTPGIDLFRFGAALSGPSLHLVWASRSRLEKVPVGQSSWTWTWGDIYHLRSSDGGVTWDQPVRLNGKLGAAMRPVVAASGRFVHVAWYDQSAARKNPEWDWDVYYRRSTDAGATWGPEVRMTDTPTHTRHPQIVATTGNRVCCIWEDGQTFNGTGMVGDPALYAATSTDNGETWRKPRRITAINAPNGFATHAKTYAFGSRVHLTWQDAPEGPRHPRAIYYMTSPDGGQRWLPAERLTPTSEEMWETGAVVGTDSWALVEMMKGGGLWYRRRDLSLDSSTSE